MSATPLTALRAGAAAVAIGLAALVSPAHAAAASKGTFLAHLNCNLGAGKRAGMDVYADPIVKGRLSHVDYNTSPPFHAEKVQLMIRYDLAAYPYTFSTVAIWGDGSTGSVKTSFGSEQAAGTIYYPGQTTLKMKITETGSDNWDCSQVPI